MKKKDLEKVKDIIGYSIIQHSNDVESHRNPMSRVIKLESDLNLLMSHLKIEFKDIPSDPAKRVVGKATKKTHKKGQQPTNPAPSVNPFSHYYDAQTNVPWSPYPVTFFKSYTW
jgi:hypothetical protein